jgi:hypothetical protein
VTRKTTGKKRSRDTAIAIACLTISARKKLASHRRKANTFIG